jgi:flavin reductase (DIM6/NTAB) family NADH-FMN oxidoreductase RutF
VKKSIEPRTIVFPAPAFVIGTYTAAGKPNAMTVAWAGICSSQPPSIGIALRKATLTYLNIIERKAFTVNIPSEQFVVEVDYLGIVSGKEEDKFAITGLTAVAGSLVDAPYIAEFPMVLECSLTNTVELGLHTQFIGEILDLKVDESVLGSTGVPDAEKVKPIVYSPEMRRYYGLGSFLGKAFSIGKTLKQRTLRES